MNSNRLKADKKLVDPDILLGINYYHELNVRAEKRLNNGFWLVDSKLGKMISGVGKVSKGRGWMHVQAHPIIALLSQNVTTEIDPSIKIQGHEDSEDLSLNQLVARANDLEFMGLGDANEPSSDEKWMEHFEKTIEYVNGRYQVALPWHEDVTSLPCNRGLAWG